MPPLNIFISYSHADVAYKQELEKRLSILKAGFEGLICWSDSRIEVGDLLDPGIDSALRQASVFIPLISSDYLVSNPCWKVEYATARELRNLGKLEIIPIIIRPCSWLNTNLREFLCAPKDGKAISSWSDSDEAWLDVEEALRSKFSSIVGSKRSKTESSPAALIEIIKPRIVALRPSGCTEMLPPIEFSFVDELLRSDFGDIQVFFNTNVTSRLVDDPISECYVTIESEPRSELSEPATTFEIHGVQYGANSIIFRSFPLYLLRSDGSRRHRIAVRHIRVNMNQLGPQPARVFVAIQLRSIYGEWLTQGDIAFQGSNTICEVRRLVRNEVTVTQKAQHSRDVSSNSIADTPAESIHVILRFSRLAGTDARNSFTPLSFGVWVRAEKPISVIASLYNIDVNMGSSGRLTPCDANGGRVSREIAEVLSVTHKVVYNSVALDGVEVVGMPCLWRVNPGPSLEDDVLTVIISLLPVATSSLFASKNRILLQPFLAPLSTVTTASASAPIPRFAPAAVDAIDLDSDREDWTILL